MDNLRIEAESRIFHNRVLLNDLTELELHKLIEELQIHQVELQLQNDELLQSRLLIEKAQQKYFNLFDLAPVGYLVLNDNGIINEININACDIFKRRNDHLQHRPFVSLLAPVSMTTFYNCFNEVQKKHQNASTYLEIVAKKNRRIVEITISKYISSDYLMVVTDVTERLASEKQLKESNVAKDKIFSIIAHDLKSPFSSILGFIELLEKNYQKYDDKKRISFIHRIGEAAKNTYRLLENLLTWSRSQTGKIKLQPEEMDMSEVVHEAIALMQHSATSKEISIHNQLTINYLVWSDPNTTHTIVRNLLSNAIKFTNRGGIISIEADTIHIENKPFVELRISDNGVGIAPEQLMAIFEIEKNITSKGTENEHGTGLGLILCKDFVEKNGGKIGVESQIGMGSTFYFTLPKV